MDLTTLYYVIAALLVLAGLLGTVLPVLPGVPLMFAGMLLAAWAVLAACRRASACR